MCMYTHPYIFSACRERSGGYTSSGNLQREIMLKGRGWQGGNEETLHGVYVFALFTVSIHSPNTFITKLLK